MGNYVTVAIVILILFVLAVGINFALYKIRKARSNKKTKDLIRLNTGYLF